MGTCNFHKHFALNYYVVDGKRYYDSDWNELDEWEEGCNVQDDTEYLLENIVDGAIESGWKLPSDKSRIGYSDDWVLCEKWEDKDLIVGTTPIEIQMQVICCPGYYEAANLDWDLRFHIPGSGWDYNLSDFCSIEELADEIADAFMDYEDVWNEGLKKMQKKNIVKKALERIREVGLKVDDFCKQNCTGVYGVSARFSNGETWYTKIA